MCWFLNFSCSTFWSWTKSLTKFIIPWSLAVGGQMASELPQMLHMRAWTRDPIRRFVQQGSRNKNPLNPSRWRISGDWSCRCKVSQFLPALWFTGENWLTDFGTGSDVWSLLQVAAWWWWCFFFEILFTGFQSDGWLIMTCHVYSWTCSVERCRRSGFPARNDPLPCTKSPWWKTGGNGAIAWGRFVETLEASVSWAKCLFCCFLCPESRDSERRGSFGIALGCSIQNKCIWFI